MAKETRHHSCDAKLWRLLPISTLALLVGCTSGTSNNDTADDTDGGGDALTVSINDAEVAEGNASDSRQIRFNVALSAAPARTTTVDFSSEDGTATSADYQASSGTVTFLTGETSKEIRIDVIGDALVEPDETFNVNLSNPVGATLGDAMAVGTIRNDDGTPHITVEDGREFEGDPGDSPAMTFVANLSAASTATVQVSYETEGLTATADEDFNTVSGLISFAPGVTQASVIVPVIGDDIAEDNETLALNLSNPQNATTQDRAIGVIVDDDAPRQLSIDDAAASESDDNIEFSVTLDDATGQEIQVDFATVDGSATSPEDYSSSADTLIFAPGEVSKTISIALVDDDTTEDTEQFTLVLSNPQNAVLGNGTGTGTITDDDTPAPPESLDAFLIDDVPTANRCDFINPEYCLYPFPNNFFTTTSGTTDTGLLLNLDINSMPKNSNGKPIDPLEWNRSDGFSPGSMIQVRIPDLDLAQTGAVPLTNIEDSFRVDQPIVLLNMDTGERALIWAELDDNGTKQTTAGEETPANPAGVDPGPALIIRPAKNLVPGDRYAVALRNLKDENGSLLTVPPEFRVCRDVAPTSLPQVASRCAQLEPVFDALADAGIARNELNLAWDFTVISDRNMTERLLHIRDDALASIGAAPPTVVIDSIIENPGSGDIQEITARRIRGHITVPCYLDTPNCMAGGKFNYTPDGSGLFGDGLPDRLGGTATSSVPFICSIPRVTINGADSALLATSVNPARMSLYGHGLLGSRDEGNTYDSNVRRMAQEHNFVFCMVDWAGMATGNTPDDENDPAKYDPAWDGALQDAATVASILVDVSNFPKLVDRLQQGMLNFITLGKAMLHPAGLCAQPAFQAAGQCVLDRSELFYDGNSQGGIFGGTLIAVSPDIRAGVLGVPGMNYSTLLRRSVDFDFYAQAMYASYRSSLDQTFVLGFIQMLWDRADTNGYARYLAPGNNLPGTTAKRVLLHPAFSDHQVTSYSAEVEARTMEAQTHCPSFIAGPDAQSGPRVAAAPHPFVGDAGRGNAGFDPLEFGRRHPDNDPMFGIPCLSYPYSGNAIVQWDSGPRFDDAGNERGDGYSPPPIGNVPPRPELGYGADPHGHPRNDVHVRLQKSEWLKTDGVLINVCEEAGVSQPCTTRNFDPTP